MPVIKAGRLISPKESEKIGRRDGDIQNIRLSIAPLNKQQHFRVFRLEHQKALLTFEMENFILFREKEKNLFRIRIFYPHAGLALTFLASWQAGTNSKQKSSQNEHSTWRLNGHRTGSDQSMVI